MPRNGTPRARASRTASASPLSRRNSIASPKLPTPGSTTPEASRMSAGSSVTSTSPPASTRPRSTELRFPLW